MRGYDQWKTASPYDDEPDPFDEAYAFLKANEKTRDPEIERARFVIESLLDSLEENGVATSRESLSTGRKQ